MTTLRERKVGNGKLTLVLIRSAAPGTKRLVQWRAEYTEAGVFTTQVVGCEDELDEARQLARLERVILAASARPSDANTDALAEDAPEPAI